MIITFLEHKSLQEKLITFGKKAYPKFGNVVILAGGAGCFEGQTLVKTIDEMKQIKDVKVGDQVLTFNEETKEYEYKEVLDNLQHYAPLKELVKVTMEDGSSFVCTSDHEFLIEDQWVKAEDLI